jgi:putative MFS transporter
MTVCNACRYCEAYCPVFPALERRRAFSERDLAYLSNLCHNCGECLYACPYAPPHEFGINVPRTLAAIRVHSYAAYSWPRGFCAPWRRPRLWAFLFLAMGALLVAVALRARGEGWQAQVDAGDFYRVMPHGIMIGLFGGVFLLALTALGVGAVRFWRHICGTAPAFGDSSRVSGATWIEAGSFWPAFKDAVTLRHLQVQGAPCTDAVEVRRPWRRWFHHLTFYGFALCFASTSVAALYHTGFGWRAPYAYTSLPVALGVVGGIGLLIGPLGLLAVRRTRDNALGDGEEDRVDVSLTILLALTSATGFALLVFRETPDMPALLILHLSVVLGLFLSLPYGKFVHGIYRALALVQYYAEEGRRVRGRVSPSLSALHRRMVVVLGYVFFFELGDLNSFAFAAPAIRESWHLSLATTSQVISASFIGMFVGAAAGGWFSDRVGRKRALIVTTMWYSVCSLLTAFVWDVRGLYFMRLLTGVGLSAMTVVAITYISEVFPAARRGACQAWIMTIGLCGIPATAYVARFLVPLAPWGWRAVFVWGSLALFFPLIAGTLEESPRWLEAAGKHEEAARILARIEALPGRDGSDPAAQGPTPGRPAQARTGLADLVARSVRGRVALFVTVWISQTLGFYGFNAWVPTLLAERGFSIARSLEQSSVMQIGAVPGAWIAASISDRWERKSLIAVVALLIAACGMSFGFSTTSAGIVVFGFLVAMGQQVFAPLLYAYTPECFPTPIRNTAAGAAYGIGRLGNAGGPWLVAYLFSRFGYQSVFAYIAVCWAMVAVLTTAFGPKTSGKPLE